MPIPTQTLDQWIARSIANFRTSFKGWPMGSKKFLGRISRALANVGWTLHKAIEDVDKDIVPSIQSSPQALSDWATELGLPNGAGGYGPLAPTQATGGGANLTGVNGTVYPNLATATAEDGTTQIALSGSVTIGGSPPGFGSVAGSFYAVTPGAIGNLVVGTVCTWDSAPAGADASFTITTAFEGGIDAEGNPFIVDRITQRLQTPPRGGVEQDFRLWANQATGTANITGYVYPKHSGTGTVDVVVTVAGSGIGRLPTSAQQTLVSNYIATQKPASIESVSVLLPSMPAANGHAARVRVIPSANKYAFDWASGSAGFAVDAGGYIAGTPNKIRFAGLVDVSLENAITSFIAGNGLAPRLQVISSTAAPPINLPIRAVAFDAAHTGGKSTITLDTLPVGWVPPSSGDIVHAYGPVVQTIAQSILNFCDSLGPSRLSGFADTTAPWNDTLTISGLIGAAERASDIDGTKLINEVPVTFATIDGVVADVAAGDTGTPELLYLKSVAVTP